MKIFSTNRHNKTASYIAPVATAIAFLFAVNLQAQQYPAEEGYAFEDAQYLYKWVTPEYPPLPDVNVDGEFFTWEEVYGPLPILDPILRRYSKFPREVIPVKESDDAEPILHNTPVIKSYEQTISELHEYSVNSAKKEKQARENLVALAEEKGILTTISGRNGGGNSTLIDITDKGEPVYVSPSGIRGAATIGVHKLWPANLIPGNPIITGQSGLNLSGSGQIIGMWEAPYNGGHAVQTNHQQFLKEYGESKVVMVHPGSISPHATAVAGVMVSSGTGTTDPEKYSRGISYNATVRAYSLTDFADTFSNEAANHRRLANNSYEIKAGWGKNGDDWIWYGNPVSTPTEDWKFGAYMGGTVDGAITPLKLDEQAFNAKYTLMVFPSGNARGVGPQFGETFYRAGSSTPEMNITTLVNGGTEGYDTLSPSACAKNVLTVGGINAIPEGEVGPNLVSLYQKSSCGPTDDGRIKPEVVAAATATNPSLLYLLSHDPFAPNSPSYQTSEGTSYAAAAVTAGLSLVLEERNNICSTWENPPAGQERYPFQSSTLRALAVHTAMPATDSPGPSFKYGYGVFNAKGAVDLMKADASTNSKPFIKEVYLPARTSYLTNDVIHFGVRAANASTPMKVTIAWTDNAGSAQTTEILDETTKRLSNDLDLRVYPPGVTNYTPNASTTFKPFTLNPSNPGAPATTGNDSINNLEQVVVNVPNTNGVYTVRVERAANSPGVDAQWASIILSGVVIPEEEAPEITCFRRLNNNEVELTWKAVAGGIYRIQGAIGAMGPWDDLELVSNQSSIGPGNTSINAHKELMREAAQKITSSQSFFRIKRIY